MVDDRFMETDVATGATFEPCALTRSEVINCIAHLRAYAVVLAGDRQRADDLVRDTIMQTFTAVNRPSVLISLKVRMFAALRKLHYGALRQSTEQAAQQPEPQSSKEDGLESDELLRIFDRLRDQQREALILTVASGLSHEQAAEVCDCQIDTIKSWVLDAWCEISRMLRGTSREQQIKFETLAEKRAFKPSAHLIYTLWDLAPTKSAGTARPMNNGHILTPSPRGLPDAQRLPGILSRYRNPNLARSLTEIAVTLAPFAALWAAMWALMHISYWLTLALASPAAGFLVRLFMIQHDCGHGAFFRTRAINDWVGRALSVLTLTPYDYWKRTHAAHHAGAGNLGRRGLGDIETLTVDEYMNLNRRKRFAYRLYRHPLVMFGIGPSYLFLLRHRAPLGLMRGAGWKPWVSTMSTNVGIAIVVALLMWLVGPGPFLMVQGPIFVLAATIGVWLFYVQHQFEDTRWAHEVNWDLPQTALYGSSHYDLPVILRWFSANIGVHHVHHLASRVPFYRLPEILRDYPELTNIGRLTLWQSLRCVHYSLWDEHTQRLISFTTLGRPHVDANRQMTASPRLKRASETNGHPLGSPTLNIGT